MPSMTFQPVSVVNDPQFGTTPWTNPDGFRVKYYGQANCNIPDGGQTQYAAGAFDLSALPAGITLAGIKASIQANHNSPGGGYPRDASVRIGQAGAPVGDDKARPTQPWALAQTYRDFGGATDLWNAGIDADSLRENGLVVFFAAKHDIGPGDGQGPAVARGDDMKLTIYW